MTEVIILSIVALIVGALVFGGSFLAYHYGNMQGTSEEEEARRAERAKQYPTN